MQLEVHLLHVNALISLTLAPLSWPLVLTSHCWQMHDVFVLDLTIIKLKHFQKLILAEYFAWWSS